MNSQASGQTEANTLCIIIEQSLECRTPLFVEFKKAFDTIRRTAIQKAVNRKLVSQNIIRIIKAMYEDAEFSLLYNGNISQSFHTNAGVKQECSISPQLFTVVIEFCSERRGIRLCLLSHIKNLYYGDDEVSNKQTKQEDLERIVPNAGLEINIVTQIETI